MSWIIPEIEARGGAVPFDEFMELALYHPDHGYYSAERPRYGREGDYLTAPTSSEWYPRVFARLLTRLATNGPVRWIDVASGDGAMIAGVSESLGSTLEETVSTIVSLDRSSAMRSAQVDRFSGLGVEVEVRTSLAGAATFSGPAIVHASELYDALPVARVVGTGDGLTESWVAAGAGRLWWHDRPPRDRVVAYFNRHGIVLEEGQVAEANLRAEETHRDLLRNAGADSLVLVLDYGYESRRLYNPRGRFNGSLSTFRDHRVGRDPLDRPGEIDLTAHVNWDDLRAAAGDGWTEIGLWPLAEFLVRAGIGDELEARGFGMDAELNADTVGVRQEVKRLLDPEGMGSDLKVLVQAKGAMIDIAHRALSIE